jgi:prolyl-tRNA editing enzyme YbaK/EbsC (Cys-tRNA(Pro) deacylase)
VTSTNVPPVELPPAVAAIARSLAELSHPHAPVMLPDSARTAVEAAAALGCEVAQIAKTIVFRRVADDVPVVVVASGSNRIDPTLVGERVGEIGRADAEYVKARIGVAIGGVSPVGLPDDAVVLVDADLTRLDPLWCAAGHPHAVVQTDAASLVAWTGGELVTIC